MNIIECEEEQLLIVPFTFQDNSLKNLFLYIKETWGIEQCRAGVGSLITLEEVQKKDFEEYSGLFTLALDNTVCNNIFIKPKGRYLNGYIKGTWDKLPKMYEKMLDYAKRNNIELEGYAYEKGLNDFAINDKNKYITQISIKIKENT